MVDDEPDILATLAPAIEARLGLPVEVEVAGSGKEARAMVEAGRAYDMVITDERMPGLRGSELLGWLGHHRPRTLRVLMTAYLASLGDDARQQARPHLFFTKPFDAQAMFSALRAALLAQGPAPASA